MGEPIVFGISDGVDTVVALFKPEVQKPAPPSRTLCTASTAAPRMPPTGSLATPASTSAMACCVRLSVLRVSLGSGPREITPSTGDSFTVLDKWMDLDANGNPAGTTMLEGGSLTFGDSMFTWEELDAAAGAYVVGFVVQNLDGNSYETLDVVTVQ